MLRRGLLLCLCLLAAPLVCGSAPPFEESLDLTLVTLNRMTLKREPARARGLLPLKATGLPASVRLYLRPTHQLDLYSPSVGKAAARVRRAVAPRAKDKDALRDSVAVAGAVNAWLNAHFIADEGLDGGAQPCVDWRLAYPKASVLLRQGRGDLNGRALVAVALLRVLKVPARVALARGGLTAQYWVEAKALSGRVPGRRRPRRTKRARSRAPGTPLGWWARLDPSLGDVDVDAWSLDPSGLECLRWKPGQELSVSMDGWERVAFAQDESAAARTAFDAGLSAGRLSSTALSGSLSATADAALASSGRGEAVLWVLTAQRWRLRSEGAMQGMSSVQLLTPYRPDLPSWGREADGVVRASELEAQGVWSDRPGRLRLHKDLADEYFSPPPALGILHWYDLGVRRQPNVLQAARQGVQVQGVVFRGDNLTPRKGWSVQIQAEGSTQTVSAVVDGTGHFSADLAPGLAGAECLDVVVETPDQQRIEQRLLKD